MSSPAMTFLRQLAIAVAARNKLKVPLRAGQLSEIAFDAGITIPGLRMVGDDEAATKAIGMTMARAFGEDDTITTDVYKVNRFKTKIERKDNTKGGGFESKSYIFELNSPSGPTPPPSPAQVTATPPPSAPTCSATDEIESTD